jgi:hypothetical protein
LEAATSKLKRAEKDLEEIENFAPNSFVAPSTPARMSFSINATPQKKGKYKGKISGKESMKTHLTKDFN